MQNQALQEAYREIEREAGGESSKASPRNAISKKKTDAQNLILRKFPSTMMFGNFLDQ